MFLIVIHMNKEYLLTENESNSIHQNIYRIHYQSFILLINYHIRYVIELAC